MDKSKNVFISHYHKDDNHIPKLQELVKEHGYNLKNSSISRDRPNNLKSEDGVKRLLRLRIQWASTVIVLIGPNTHKRPWVDWEIEQAHRKGKRIVGVYVNGAGDSDVPNKFNLYGDALIGWRAERIIAAIEGNINNFECPDGTEWENPFVVVREVC